MKKSRLIFIIILSFFVNSLIAQNVSIGIKDGLSWSTINGSYYFHDRKVAEISKIKGRNFGILINFPINKFVSLQTELNYNEKGFEFNSNNSNMCGAAVYSGNYNLTYLVTPLLINYELGKGIKYYGYVGASFGFLLKADNQASFVTSLYPPLRYDYNDNVMKKFNNMQNIQKECEKKSYKEPQLKKIGMLSQITQGNGTSMYKDNGGLAQNANNAGS